MSAVTLTGMQLFLAIAALVIIYAATAFLVCADNSISVGLGGIASLASIAGIVWYAVR